jgi:hypothetical protein
MTAAAMRAALSLFWIARLRAGQTRYAEHSKAHLILVRPNRGSLESRLYSRRSKGERLVDKVPHSRWKTATFLAALRNDRIDAPSLVDGPINGERFRAYVEQFLTPTLKPGDVVILDNLGYH